jgi:hypothetical protein
LRERDARSRASRSVWAAMLLTLKVWNIEGEPGRSAPIDRELHKLDHDPIALACSFESKRPHRFRCVGNRICEVVSACTPPAF